MYWDFQINESSQLRLGGTARESKTDGSEISAPALSSSGAQAASYITGVRSFLGVKRPVRGVGHPHPSRAEVKGRVELCFYSPWAFETCYRLTFTFTFGILKRKACHKIYTPKLHTRFQEQIHHIRDITQKSTNSITQYTYIK
jgi:hypothetical protein